MTDRPTGRAPVPTDRGTAIKLAVGFGVALVLVYLLGVAVGWDRTIARLRGSDLRWLAAGCLSTTLCLACWARSWQIVLAVGDVSVPYRRLVVTFFAATFANYVTPFGQAGGEPFIAYVLSKDTAASYEESLASVVTSDLLRLLPFLNAAIVGVGYLALTAGITERVDQYAALLGVLAVGLPIAVVTGWQFRDGVRREVLRLLAPLFRRTDRVGLDDVSERIDRLYAALERIASSPRALVRATAYSYVGWAFFALPLYFAGLTLDLHVPLLLVCFLVPVVVLAGMVPVPGGLAAIEGTLVGLLAALTALSAADALAVTAVYRIASYWFVLAVGGAASLWVLKRV